MWTWFPCLVASMLADPGSLVGTYERAAPAVVALTCEVRGVGVFFGTGTIIDPSGLVVTSTTVVPSGAQNLRVFVLGGAIHPGKPLAVDERTELSLVRIEAPPGSPPFPSVPLGDSDDIQVGETAITLGNAFQSIQDDDQVTLGAGVVSGLYSLAETHDQSSYRGKVIETTAHLNDGMDGGPLLDGAGSLIGVLCLNYSRSRWLGTAVPINELKPLIARQRGWLSDKLEEFPAYAGLELEQPDAGGLKVLKVYSDGPALAAGIRPGDRVISIAGEEMRSIEDLRGMLHKSRTGETLEVAILRGMERLTLKIKLWGKTWRWA